MIRTIALALALAFAATVAVPLATPAQAQDSSGCSFSKKPPGATS